MAKRLDDLSPKKHWTVEEFLDFDDGTDTHYELLNGRVVAMAPPRAAHGEMTTNIASQLKAQLRAPCRVISVAGIKLADACNSFYEADLAVSCAPRTPGSPWVEAPVLIVEILSPSTERNDRLTKLGNYEALPSVQEILYARTDRRELMVFSRHGEEWRQVYYLQGAKVRLDSVGATIDMEELYEGFVLDPPTVEAL